MKLGGLEDIDEVKAMKYFHTSLFLHGACLDPHKDARYGNDIWISTLEYATLGRHTVDRFQQCLYGGRTCTDQMP